MRPRSPFELAESQQFARIASLAASIMVTLRQEGRGVAESERQLRAWLQADGVEFGDDFLAPALVLLEATKRIGRSPARKNLPRRVWLATNAPGESQMDTEDAPGVAVEDLGRIAAKLARWIHRDGTQLRYDVEKSLAGMSRQWSVDDVLDCAVVKGWLVNHGDRVSGGETDPGWSIERDTSARYVPVGEAEYVPS